MTAAPAAAPTAPRTPPILLPALIVLLAMTLAAVSMTAVFSDTVWLVQVLAMVAVVLLTGAVFRAVPAPVSYTHLTLPTKA